MFGAVGGTGLTVVFALVLAYAVVDASTSTVHAFLDRIESALNEARRPGGVWLIWRQTHQVVAEEPAASSAIP
jgi:hypothetical protein